MSEKNTFVLGISCGDIHGVGLEILIRAFSNNNLFSFCTPVLYAPTSALNFYKKKNNSNTFNYHVIKTPNQASSKQFNVIKFSQDSIQINPGINETINNEIALQSIDLVIKDLKNNLLDAVLTLPVNKEGVAQIKKGFVGHTEYFSESFAKKETLMLLCNENLKIGTVTNHAPISRVSSLINSELLKTKIKICIETLKIDFSIEKPKIAILGLNPHAGDNGLIGDEELEVISPVVRYFFENDNLVYGPYSADGFFGSGNYNSFDAILGMYHDQALIPFKQMSFGSGVNYTAGLPIIRVSPDHGVGYDIVGRGTPSIKSLISAIFLARKIYGNRKVYSDSIRKTENM